VKAAELTLEAIAVGAFNSPNAIAPADTTASRPRPRRPVGKNPRRELRHARIPRSCMFAPMMRSPDSAVTDVLNAAARLD
jgi:hypothetical protein